MNPNFSEELQTMYRNILLQQHNIAYASMLAAFSSPGNAIIGSGLGTPSNFTFSLDSDIPKEEIECEVELIVVKNLRDNLKELETNLNGLHGKKFGFREVIEMASARTAYPASPNTAVLKRNRTSSDGSFGSPITLLPSTPLTPKSIESKEKDETSAKKMRLGDDTETTFDDSNASSHDGHLQIDWNESATEEAKKVKTPEDEAEGNANEMVTDEQAAKIKEQDSDEYNPAKLRVERLKSIQKKKPKFNIDTSELSYHSNMARNFPGSENRTEDQQLRRSKNTLAARISRTKNKAYERMLEKQSLEATTENINMKRRVACLRVYANSLMKLSGLPDANFSKMWETNIKDIVCSTERSKWSIYKSLL